MGLSQGRRAPASGGLDNQRQAGRAIWQREGLKVSISNPSAASSGWPTDRASGCGREQRKTAYIERGSPWENGYIESFKRPPAR